MLPQYSVFQRNYEQGGLTASILKNMLDSRLLSIWLKLLTSTSFWATTERALATSELYNKRNLNPKEALTQTPCKTKGYKLIWDTAYKLLKGLKNEPTPYTLNDIFQATNIKDKKKKEAAKFGST
ncbi:858_t:CDS:2 [Ambispora leptoticha]|uniref:858_t:CDS:1 n=1 Tax=Ambispora leptoticha TaxID=144679 RepID=A0A9N9C9Q0_9GLOM|nr:858_t:CDS:2 [Ambispora leptoticha]